MRSSDTSPQSSTQQYRPSGVKVRLYGHSPIFTLRRTFRDATSTMLITRLLSWIAHACVPSGVSTIRFGTPPPSGMVATTSSRVVSMTEIVPECVFVTYSSLARALTGHAASANRTARRDRFIGGAGSSVGRWTWALESAPSIASGRAPAHP